MPLIECAACGGLRRATTAPCPHCAAAGPSARRLRRLALALALGGTACGGTPAKKAPLVVEYGPAMCDPPGCVSQMPDASVDAGDCGEGDDAGNPDAGYAG